MKRVRRLLVRAFVGALVLLSLGASLASADPGVNDRGSTQYMLPEDPGLE